MSYWISLAILILSAGTLIVWFWRWAAGPSPIRLSSPSVVREVFQTVLSRGTKGARVRLQSEGDRAARMDFVKYIKAPGNIGLRAVVEKTVQTDGAYASLLKSVNQRGLECFTTKSKQLERLEIEVGTDTALAEFLARVAFEDGLGLDLSRDVVGFYDLVLMRNAPRLTGVESP